MAPYVGNFINLAGTTAAKSNVPGMSDAAKMLFGSNPYNDKLVSVPVESLVENSLKAIPSLYKALAGEGSAKTAARNTLDALTAVTGMPFSAVKKPVGYLAGVAAGDIEPETPLDVARGIIGGKDVNK